MLRAPFLPARPRRVDVPGMQRDRAGFFPAVLCDEGFDRDGVLFGSERMAGLPIHWAVVDPSRHAMHVWEKHEPSYPRAARALGAPLFTNGPFTQYAHGSFARSSARFAIDAARVTRATLSAGRHTRSDVGPRALALRHFQASRAMGYVVGARDGIVETAVSRPRLFHFGRRGPDFADYEIGRGDPVGMSEAIGGLFGGVSGYRPYTVDQFIRVGYWCLVPLDTDPALRAHGLEAARGAYQERHDVDCAGVLMVVAGLARTQRLTHLLSAIRVQHAVQIDGGDSLLLGSGTRLRQGTFMPEWKRLLQRWGLQFVPRQSGDT